MSEGLAVVPSSQFNDMGAMVNIPLSQLEQLKKAYSDLESRYFETEKKLNETQANTKAVTITIGEKTFHNESVYDEWENRYKDIFTEKFEVRHVESIGLETLEQDAYKQAEASLRTEIDTMAKTRDTALAQMDSYEKQLTRKLEKLQLREDELELRSQTLDNKDTKVLLRKVENRDNKLKLKEDEIKALKSEVKTYIKEMERLEDAKLRATSMAEATEGYCNELKLDVEKLKTKVDMFVHTPKPTRLFNWSNHVQQILES